MNKNFLLVDGYNIIHAWDNLKEMSEVSLESARAEFNGDNEQLSRV